MSATTDVPSAFPRGTASGPHPALVFDDVITDPAFSHRLTYHAFGGAALGECYTPAAETTPSDPDS
jgi:hypothetical protein